MAFFIGGVGEFLLHRRRYDVLIMKLLVPLTRLDDNVMTNQKPVYPSIYVRAYVPKLAYVYIHARMDCIRHLAGVCFLLHSFGSRGGIGSVGKGSATHSGGRYLNAKRQTLDTKR